ncbi:MAG: LON peptidase substrate-binding domain-containing protein [Candidatus Dadabacteria bacterium]|nr:LON peptidase substrate-binding domain-containing protein [Candidatus Dadabacteria bacterium]
MELPELDLNNVANLKNFSGVVPLFPLSSVVFFPNTLLPLHIFEPRYKEMVNAAINNEKIIGMALLKPGWESDYYGNPDVYDIIGMGRIVSSDVFEDGKINIILYGLKRAKIQEIIKDLPYRLARVDIVENNHDADDEIYRRKIEELIYKWNLYLNEKQKSHRINVNTKLPLENLTDTLASLIFSNVFDKQRILEETKVLKRAEIIIHDLQTRLKIVSITSQKRNEIMKKRNLN